MAENDQGKKRQAIIGFILVVVVGFMGWQIFGGKHDAEAPSGQMASNTPPPPPMPKPKPAEVPKQAAPLTPREIEMMQAQQELETKYLAAVNELQMLKIERDIAETTKAIASAKLDTVNAQKGIVTLLAPEQNGNYSQKLSDPQSNTAAVNTGNQNNVPALAVSYTVISITEIQGRWGAVIGAQGKLYSVHVGDVLPTDSSKVTDIDRSGVIIEKDGVKKTISMVPII